jgi:hypothetical protein
MPGSVLVSLKCLVDVTIVKRYIDADIVPPIACADELVSRAAAGPRPPTPHLTTTFGTQTHTWYCWFIICVEQSMPLSQQPYPGCEWYQPTTFS